MLEALRRGSQGIVVKLLLALLILSFAVWGVGDMITGFTRSNLAEVGEVEITPEEYQRAFQNELNALSYRAGRRITAEQARAFGLDSQVLNRLIGWAAVDTHTRELNLSLSDKAIAEGLKRDPAFQGPDGKYSRAAVEQVMRQLNLSEAGFLRLRRQEELRRQVTGALSEAVVVPKAMIDVLHGYREETRILDYVRIDSDKVVKIEAPDEAKLKDTYEANKAQFATKPSRKLAVLVASMEDAKKRVKVSDEEAKAAYEQEKETYNTPEKRRVQQIAFPDKAAAEAAKAAIVAAPRAALASFRLSQSRAHVTQPGSLYTSSPQRIAQRIRCAGVGITTGSWHRSTRSLEHPTFVGSSARTSPSATQSTPPPLRRNSPWMGSSNSPSSACRYAWRQPGLQSLPPHSTSTHCSGTHHVSPGSPRRV